jgi:hypothetical protein
MPYTFQSETSDIVGVKKSKINKAGKEASNEKR